jgi:hypothetical protein
MSLSRACTTKWSPRPFPFSSRMLKKSASFVLALFRGSTYRTEYASPLRVLRPCWTNFLSILPGILPLPQTRGPLHFHRAAILFPQPANFKGDPVESMIARG